jgi:hypothetical protein
MEECLPSRCKALSSSPSATRKKKEKNTAILTVKKVYKHKSITRKMLFDYGNMEAKE